MKFLIVTGLSGAGKSLSIRYLEDFGYFCVDNLPPALIVKFAELWKQSKSAAENIALVIDIRGGNFFDQLQASLEELRNAGFDYEVLFLEAADEILIKRYKASRRKHPLAADGRIIRGIKAERRKLEHIKSKASFIIDTSNMQPSDLKDEMKHIFLEGGESEGINITVVSFGFKYGIPLDSDMVFDVRFLPNPYYIESLRKHSGMDEGVRSYVMQWPQAEEFMHKLEDMVEFLIPNFIKEGKSQLVIAIGCTGGRHRSVTMVNMLSQKLKQNKHRVIVEHRDIEEDNH